jgi:hypothetical protein
MESPKEPSSGSPGPFTSGRMVYRPRLRNLLVCACSFQRALAGMAFSKEESHLCAEGFGVVG